MPALQACCPPPIALVLILASAGTHPQACSGPDACISTPRCLPGGSPSASTQGWGGCGMQGVHHLLGITSWGIPFLQCSALLCCRGYSRVGGASLPESFCGGASVSSPYPARAALPAAPARHGGRKGGRSMEASLPPGRCLGSPCCAYSRVDLFPASFPRVQEVQRWRSQGGHQMAEPKRRTRKPKKLVG